VSSSAIRARDTTAAGRRHADQQPSACVEVKVGVGVQIGSGRADDRNPYLRDRLTPPPKIGEVTSWLLRHPDDLDTRSHELLAALRARCSQLDHLAGHVTSFAKMMTSRTGEHDLAGWLTLVEADDQPELHSFAAGIRQDLAAVTAGLILPYSSGTVEGNVNRLKAIKRQQMYGRASLDLLRKRVICHPA
jgi:hypothetical protein